MTHRERRFSFTVAQALSVPHGTIIYYGSASGRASCPGAEVLMKSLRIRGFVVFNCAEDAGKWERMKHQFTAHLADRVMVSLDNLGHLFDLHPQLGDADKAFAHCTRSLELREKLLADDPNSVSEAHNLVEAHCILATYCATKHRDSERASRHFGAGYDLLKRSIEQGMKVDPAAQKRYESLKAKFAGKRP